MSRKKTGTIGILSMLLLLFMVIVVQAETIKIPWPTDVTHTYKGGFALYSGHNGMDINASSGTVLYAPFDGTATFYQRYRPVNGTNVYVSYGNYVEITSTDERCPGYKVIICHMSSFSGASFKVNAVNATGYYSDHSGAMSVASWNSATDKIANCGTKEVYMGDIVGYSGSTGRSTGPHLHITLYKGSTLVDPYSYFDDTISAYDYARSVMIKSEIPTLYIDETNTFLWYVKEGIDKSTVRWKAEPSGIVEINNNGDVKGKAEGVATVRAYVVRKDGKEIPSPESRTITVKKPTIKLNYTTATIYGNETLQLKATVEGPKKDVVWKVNSTLYSRVDNNGLVKMGSMETTKAVATTVTATANGVSATCKVTRKPALLKFIQDNWMLNAGVSKTIKVSARGTSKVKYASNNTKVATVDSSTGKVTIKKEGTAKITATGGGGLASYTIKAKPTVKVNATSLKLNMDTSKKLKVTVKGSSARKKWSSSNAKIASVSSNGKIKAKAPGTATITVTVKGVHGNVSASCKVTVVGPTITLNKTSLKLGKDEKAALIATVKNSKKNVKWKTSNSKVVSISKKKNTVTLKAKKAGTATITAYIGNAKASCKVTVQEVDWKSLYYNFLKKAETSYSYKSGKYNVTSKAGSFYLIHLNSDKIPELAVSWDSVGYGGPESFNVFTVKNEKVVFCGSVSQKGRYNLVYNRKYKAISNGWWTNGVGGSGEALWIVKNGKLVEYKYAYCYMDKGGYSYKTGNTSASAKKVSRSASNSFCKKYFNSKNQVAGTRLRNIESVRLKQFK